MKKSILEVQKRFPDGLPLLDPVEDMHITKVLYLTFSNNIVLGGTDEAWGYSDLYRYV